MKLDRITSNPVRLNGQPCIRNLRLTVRRVIELLATYPNREELHQEFPELENEDIRQALIFASSYLDDRIVEVPASYETIAQLDVTTARITVKLVTIPRHVSFFLHRSGSSVVIIAKNTQPRVSGLYLTSGNLELKTEYLYG